jgi:hypothetical protein
MRSLMIACGAVSLACVAEAAVVQHFDAPPSDWVLQNGTTGANDFGWKPSNEALGAAAGEAGGAFQRPGNTGYYADTTLQGGNRTILQSHHASGRIDLNAAASPRTDDVVVLGWFDRTKPVGASGSVEEFVGIAIRGSDLNVRASLFNGAFNGYNGSGGDLGAAETGTVAAGTYNFDITVTAYAPVGVFAGFINPAEIVVTLTPVGPGTTYVFRDALSGPQNRLSKSLNSFGLVHSNGSADVNNAMSVFIDDVTYSGIPEPASMGLLAIGAAAMMRRR